MYFYGIKIRFSYFIRRASDFYRLLLISRGLSRMRVYLFIREVRFYCGLMINFYFFFLSINFFRFTTRRSDNFFFQILYRCNIGIFRYFFVLLRFRRYFHARRTNFSRVVFRNGHFYRINGHRWIIILSFANFTWRVIYRYVSLLSDSHFTNDFFRYFMILLCRTRVNRYRRYIYRVEFRSYRFFRRFTNLFNFTHLSVGLTRVARYLRVFFSDGNLYRAFCYMVQASRALYARAIVFRSLRSFPIIFLFFAFQYF